MISQVTEQDIDLWEVWIEYDQFNPEHFGILYVIGEIKVDHKSNEPLIRKSEDGGKHLVLHVPPRSHARSRTREVSYAEPIYNIGQYTSISIYAGHELVMSLDEIEVMI
ncbi:MAG TPA: hypothetical protein VFR58_14000 [Flavisolibacter sp.]|nr:hypothetical protein [Flavisolibacter sp.]